MKKNKIIIKSDLTSDLRSYSKNIAKGMSIKVRDELKETAFNAIVKYYTSWTPNRYKRHYYNFLENSFRPYYNNPHNQIIRGGIELTPYLMDDIYSSISKESYESTGANLTNYVFNLVYSGYHGNPKMFGGTPPTVMSPSPLPE